MELRLEASKEDFLKTAKNRKIIVWGVSGCAKKYWNEFFLEGHVKYFVDKRYNEFDKSWNSLPVYSPETLKECTLSEILLIASSYWYDIVKGLKKLNYPGIVFSILNMSCQSSIMRKKASQKENILEFEKQKNILKNLMSDYDSKRLVDALYEKRLHSAIDYSDLYTDNQYFVKDLIKTNESTIFIDGGCYDANDIRRFIQFSNNEFNKVFAFELDKDNYEKINGAEFDTRVQIFNYGLWNEDIELQYNSHSENSKISSEINNCDYTARCIKLDHFLHEINDSIYIKMDIEGAEIPALKGAENIIKSYHPQLAICVYHRPKDIWEIPFLLKQWYPGYNLFLRHHSTLYWETVVYAIP